jgi:hypothetical protein
MNRLLFENDFRHVLGSRSYVFGLLIDTRVVALLGLRTRRDLISGHLPWPSFVAAAARIADIGAWIN